MDQLRAYRIELYLSDAAIGLIRVCKRKFNYPGHVSEKMSEMIV